jgi:hypothetical protein
MRERFAALETDLPCDNGPMGMSIRGALESQGGAEEFEIRRCASHAEPDLIGK